MRATKISSNSNVYQYINQTDRKRLVGPGKEEVLGMEKGGMGGEREHLAGGTRDDRNLKLSGENSTEKHLKPRKYLGLFGNMLSGQK